MKVPYYGCIISICEMGAILSAIIGALLVLGGAAIKEPGLAIGGLAVGALGAFGLVVLMTILRLLADIAESLRMATRRKREK